MTEDLLVLLLLVSLKTSDCQESFCRFRGSYYSQDDFSVQTCSKCLQWMPQDLFLDYEEDNTTVSIQRRLLAYHRSKFDIVNPLTSKFYSDRSSDEERDEFLNELDQFFKDPGDSVLLVSCCRAARACCRAILTETPQLQNPGPQCPPTWDGWQCFPNSSEAGTRVARPCPQYIYFFTHSGHNGVGCQNTAVKTCTEEGDWYVDNSTGEEWTDYSGCDKTDDTIRMEYIRSEGFYLHRLLSNTFEEQQKLGPLLSFGWGLPTLPTLLYTLIRGYNQDQMCWAQPSDQGWVEWITYLPGLLCIAGNVFFFLNIFFILLTKLRAPHANEPTNFRKAVRACSVLVPLFGLQWLVTFYRINSGSCYLLAAYKYTDLLLDSLQGFVVAVTFCYRNGEIATLLRRSYSSWRSLDQARGRRGGGRGSHCDEEVELPAGQYSSQDKIQVKQLVSRKLETLSYSVSSVGHLRDSYRRRQSSIVTTSARTEHTHVEEEEEF